MIETAAFFKTAHGPRYLGQLCKHFAHSVEVTYSDTHAECHFDRGSAILDANADGLRMVVKAVSEELVARGQSVIESHLVRFAFREKLESLDWQRQDPAA